MKAGQSSSEQFDRRADVVKLRHITQRPGRETKPVEVVIAKKVFLSHIPRYCFFSLSF
jgi:hypothetical protein